MHKPPTVLDELQRIESLLNESRSTTVCIGEQTAKRIRQALAEATQAAPGTSQAPSQVQPGQTVIPPAIYTTLRNALDTASDGRRIFIEAEAWLDTFTLKKAEQSEPEQLTVKVNPSEQAADQPDLPCVRRFPTTERDRQIVQLAIEQCDQDGVCEVDSDAMISEAAGAEGCYVQAWVWTAFDGKVEPLPPVEMPPKSALKCGCEHHGIMAGCPIHNGPAPSPFNVNPEGNPQL